MGAVPELCRGVPAVIRFVIGRIAATAATLGALSVLIFTITEVLPGDAAGTVAGRGAPPEAVERVRDQLGLDEPAVTRFAQWIADAARGDLGQAYVGGREVTAVLADRVPTSLLLAGLVYALAVPLGLLLGTFAGFGAAGVRRRGRVADRVLAALLLGAIGIPEFVLAVLLLAVLASWLGLLPLVSLVPLGGSPLDVPEILVLPVLSLAAVTTAGVARLVRASVRDVLGSPYVEAARLAGVRGWELVVRQVLPGALSPAVQALAVSAGAVVGGAVVVESIFGYPGVGVELRNAVAARDVPLVQGLTLVLCAVTLLVLLVGDIVSRLLTPAMREHP